MNKTYAAPTLTQKNKKPHLVSGAKCLFYLVGRAGLEPATNGLKVRCSTN